MKQEQSEFSEPKEIGWVSLVVDVAVSSHLVHFIARVFHKARTLRSLTHSLTHLHMPLNSSMAHLRRVSLSLPSMSLKM